MTLVCVCWLHLWCCCLLSTSLVWLTGELWGARMFPSHAPWKQEILLLLYHFWSILSQPWKLLFKYFVLCIYSSLLLMHHLETFIHSLKLYPVSTCAISKASSSCPLPVKKVTSLLMSPVAMQYGIASSLSSAISWSARLQNRQVQIVLNDALYAMKFIFLSFTFSEVW